MPIYEYQCTSCGYEMEAIQKMSDEPLRECPNCGGSTLNKKVSAPVFRLKGSGWYETDFKSGNKKQLAESESAGDNRDQSKDSQAETTVKAEGKSEAANSADTASSADKAKTQSSAASPKAADSGANSS